MIDWDKTAELNKMGVFECKAYFEKYPGSGKKVAAICDKCDKVRIIPKDGYHNLCKSCSLLGRHFTLEWREKISKAAEGNQNFKGRKYPDDQNANFTKLERKLTYEKFGYYPEGLTPHSRQKIIAVCKKCGKSRVSSKDAYRNLCNSCKMTPKTREKASASHQGIPYDEWEHFAKEQKYCPLFNEKCRESNREKHERRCFICGKPETENITKTGKVRKLSVHHVDMDKGQGCDDIRWKLVPTCMECHGMLHNDLWQARIVWLLNNVR